MAMLVITRGYRWCSWIFPHETSVSDGAPEVFPVSKRLEMRHVRRCVDLIRWLLAWRGTNMPWVWSVSVGFFPGLVNIHKAIENCHGNSGFTHSKWWFSIGMLNYQRVHWISKLAAVCEWFHGREGSAGRLVFCASLKLGIKSLLAPKWQMFYREHENDTLW